MTLVAGRFKPEFHDFDGSLESQPGFLSPNNTSINNSTNSCNNNNNNNSFTSSIPSNLETVSGSSFCVGCGSGIYDPFILHVQPDLDWHGRCLNCHKCHRSLGNDPTCFVRDRKAYCREDYVDTFYCRCAGCHQIVSKTELVFRIQTSTFHLDCFRCVSCDRLLQPGEEVAYHNGRLSCLSHAQGGRGGELGIVPPNPMDKLPNRAAPNPIVVNSLRLPQTPPRMGKTPKDSLVIGKANIDKTPIIPEATTTHLLPALLRIPTDATSTVSMTGLKDEEVDDPVDDSTVTATNTSELFEEVDETMGRSSRRRGTTAVSLNKFSDAEFPDSFCPSPQARPNSSGSSLGVMLRDTDSPLTASSELSPEDENSSLLGIGNSSLLLTDLGLPNRSGVGTSPAGTSGGYCTTQASLGGLTSTPGMPGSGSRTGSGSSSSGASVSGSCGDEVVHNVPMARGHMSRSGKSGGSRRSKDQKTTRVRTVLNEKQLHTLRTCYAANPRPDALMKEQLVEMTNLSPRVIRVWFQNKRCKDKKRQILMKQIEQQQQQTGGRSTSLHGISMIAGSPIRNDVNLVCQSVGLDVQQLPGPYWTSDLNRSSGIIGSSHCSQTTTTSTRTYNGQTGQPTSTNLGVSLGPGGVMASIVSSGLVPANCRNSLESNGTYPNTTWSKLAPSFGPLTNSPTDNRVGFSMLHPPPMEQKTTPPPTTSTTTIPLSPITCSGRFGLPLLSGDFSNEASTSSVPAFQQLVSHFETNENPTLPLSSHMLPPSALNFTTDFTKPTTESLDPIQFSNETLMGSGPNNVRLLQPTTTSPPISIDHLRSVEQANTGAYQTKSSTGLLLHGTCSSITRLTSLSQEPNLFPHMMATCTSPSLTGPSSPGTCLSFPHTRHTGGASPSLEQTATYAMSGFGGSVYPLHTGFPHMPTMVPTPSPIHCPPGALSGTTSVAPQHPPPPPPSLLTLAPRASLST